MTITFTGTRKGMTSNQKEELIGHLTRLKPTRVCHGDCIGADADFHCAVRQHFPGVIIHIHPCTLSDQRVYLKGDEMEKPNHPLVRNHTMVDFASVVIAAPSSLEEQQRSGTWATIRYARKQKKEVILLNPQPSELESVFG